MPDNHGVVHVVMQSFNVGTTGRYTSCIFACGARLTSSAIPRDAAVTCIQCIASEYEDVSWL